MDTLNFDPLQLKFECPKCDSSYQQFHIKFHLNILGSLGQPGAVSVNLLYALSFMTGKKRLMVTRQVTCEEMQVLSLNLFNQIKWSAVII